MSMRYFDFPKVLKGALDYTLDILFPVRCEICGQIRDTDKNPDGYLCTACAIAIPVHRWLFCPTCNRKLISLEPCTFHPTALKTLGAATSYDQKSVKRLIWRYKYGFIEPLAKPLADKLSEYIASAFLPHINVHDGSWLVSYVPLHPQRERWRGFNQAQLLAKHVSEKINIPITPTLRRTEFHVPQMEIKEKKNRFENIKNAFAPVPYVELRGKNIILIDDIAASGATLIEAAKVLKRAHAKSVYAFVVARSQ